jgi:hypothetical protein
MSKIPKHLETFLPKVWDMMIPNKMFGAHEKVMRAL